MVQRLTLRRRLSYNTRSNKRRMELETEPTDIKETDTASSQELNSLKEELAKMREERNYFQAQYKFQTHVNSELKILSGGFVGGGSADTG
ncbi:GM16569 [Drosophila sechellia]|uniref:GM16569 n=1 Tax=Drosophila sechellia TaxID=7238 RepID=B4INW6_DROSE|nr:GM16569 [Drosophila sechellia]